MNMARKIFAGRYQIGIWQLRRKGKQWEAFSTGGVLGHSWLYFPTLAAAHLQLTGEPMRETKEST